MDQLVRDFADSLHQKFSLPIAGQPEAQLAGPVATLLQAAGEEMGFGVVVKQETTVDEVRGRPDGAVAVGSLLTGHLELKAPGTGANTSRFTGRNREQWNFFKDLPNIIYTDGHSFALYQGGERVGKIVRFGDISTDGAGAVRSRDVEDLKALLTAFFGWRPYVPTRAEDLAKLLAPLTRFLRHEVHRTIANTDSALHQLKEDWQLALFPDADDDQFSDAYAQTFVYSLLLARLEGASSLKPSAAADVLVADHSLLGQVLRVLGDPQAYAEIETSARLLERVLLAVEPSRIVTDQELWLTFYETFLGHYDPKLRSERGVYYTPVEVVHAQVRLVAKLLETKFSKPLNFADSGVSFFDPASGTGTYDIAVVHHGLNTVREMNREPDSYATRLAQNVHAFEILVGPYAVAHLRLSQIIRDAGGSLPSGGAQVYLADTLETPYGDPPDKLSLSLRQLGKEHSRAREAKAKYSAVPVVGGNPPYDRERSEETRTDRRKGGWVRNGEGEKPDGTMDRPIFADFTEPTYEHGTSSNLQTIYNDYVYFWRWALWRAFEVGTPGPGIVTYITASSYLLGPGFSGMREYIRRTLDELWIIDLEGDRAGTRKTENVFAIKIPVAIAIGVRYGGPNPDTAAKVHYTRITGSSREKLDALEAIADFCDLTWRECPDGWSDPFLPRGDGDFHKWPALSDLIPWQDNGPQYYRRWPIAVTQEVLASRWESLVSTPEVERRKLFRESRDRNIKSEPPKLLEEGRVRTTVASEPPTAPMPKVMPYTWRSFDHQWALADSRVGDFLRPHLWRLATDDQIFFTTLMAGVLGDGPALVATPHLPDMHSFRGSFGTRGLMPLYRDSAATHANVAKSVLNALSTTYGRELKGQDLFEYIYALLGTPAYTARFYEELQIPGPRVPITRDGAMFEATRKLGAELLSLHLQQGHGGVSVGRAANTVAVPESAEDYPETFSYDLAAKTLHVGAGQFKPVEPELWEFEVSGLRVLHSWLAHRMRKPAGKRTSDLDELNQKLWSADLTDQLLDLLWTLEGTIALQPLLEANLDKVVSGPLLLNHELPEPTESERTPPGTDEDQDDPQMGLPI